LDQLTLGRSKPIFDFVPCVYHGYLPGASCLERGADLHIAQLMPLPLTVSCFSKIQIGFTFLVPAHLGIPGKRAVKRVYIDTMCVGSAASGVRGGGVEERGRRDESTAPVRAPREDPGAADDL